MHGVRIGVGVSVHKGKMGNGDRGAAARGAVEHMGPKWREGGTEGSE